MASVLRVDLEVGEDGSGGRDLTEGSPLGPVGVNAREQGANIL